MPEQARRTLVRLATSSAQASARISASFSQTSHGTHAEAASETIAAARATAAWWGLEVEALDYDVDENALAKDIALMMEAPVQYNMERLLGGQRTTVLYQLPLDAGRTGPVESDANGVPIRRLGVQLAPWLRWGSLMSYDSALAAHSLQPTLRQRWSCPVCDFKTIGEAFLLTFRDLVLKFHHGLQVRMEK